MTNAEERRLAAHRDRQANWKQWGPYLAERAWATVREDYSPDGSAWENFPHDHARSRAYRWNEDGLAGICDRDQHLCFALALWNGRDPILKERLFGVTGPEGNHGEDVKELYWYLDWTPTHSWMRMLYKYPQGEYPYDALVAESESRSAAEPEPELQETGLFDDDRYFDVFVDYAKAGECDLVVRVRVVNRGPESAPIWVLPTAWFRNTWSWGHFSGPMGDVAGRPRAQALESSKGWLGAELIHPTAGTYQFAVEGAEELLFTENETNAERLWGVPNASPWVKDAFHRYVVDGEVGAVNPALRGTKVAGLRRLDVPAGESVEVLARLSLAAFEGDPFADARDVFAQRAAEADAFYAGVQKPSLTAERKSIQRQALAGMLWSKQLYYYDVEQWLAGDPIHPPPPERRTGRNSAWEHLVNFDVMSMPDKWEYPWYATWDTAFHCISLALVDLEFAKRQLMLFTREWYMHPNGQLPAYEWAFGDVNPPVHAWAVWRVYKIEKKLRGKPDRAFLEGVFHKLLLNFTWWVNRKDAEGSNIFQGGFLGLDNIGIFDRSHELPTGGRIDQSDGTAWMAAYSLQMMRIALELAREAPVYQDLATKFFEHFLRVAHAMTNVGGSGLWDEEDGFFYDHLHLPSGEVKTLRIRSLVGLLPLCAVGTIEPSELKAMPTFRRRLTWFVKNRPHLAGAMASVETEGRGKRRLTALLTRERLERVLARMLDEEEFLSPYGIRSLSRHHEKHPFVLEADGREFSIGYEPAESEGELFGGNSNWRGPVWFPINFLIIEGLQRFHHYYGDDLTVECPTGSGNRMTLDQVACELSRRLMRLFERDADGRRPIHGDDEKLQSDPHFRDHVLFHEYFHGDTGRGLGASHQTGWTGLVAKLLQQSG